MNKNHYISTSYKRSKKRRTLRNKRRTRRTRRVYKMRGG